MYLAAILSTIAAWFMGLFLDANLQLGDPLGFTSFRILFPILTMGIFILKAVNRKNSE